MTPSTHPRGSDVEAATEPRETRWQRRPEERRSEILEAGFQVFGARGFGRATLAEVARNAGVCPGTVSHYFGSKRRLFEAVVEARTLGFIAAEEALLESHGGSSRELLEQMMRRLWDHIWTPGMCDFLRVTHVESESFPESGQLLFQHLNERWRRLVAAILERGSSCGEFRSVDADVTSRLIPWVVVGVAQKASAYGRFDPAMPDREAMWQGVLEIVNRFVLAASQDDANE